MNQTSHDAGSAGQRLTIKGVIATCVRYFLWLALLLLIPFWIALEFQEMFEEFEIVLPFATELTLGLSSKARKLAFLYVPLVLLLITGWELLILFSPNRTLSRVLKYCGWAQLVAIILLVAISLGLPTISIINELSNR